jgi:hypothetical protein
MASYAAPVSPGDDTTGNPRRSRRLELGIPKIAATARKSPTMRKPLSNQQSVSSVPGHISTEPVEIGTFLRPAAKKILDATTHPDEMIAAAMRMVFLACITCDYIDP